jgi:hypothetical protein
VSNLLLPEANPGHGESLFKNYFAEEYSVAWARPRVVTSNFFEVAAPAGEACEVAGRESFLVLRLLLILADQRRYFAAQNP